MNESLSDILSRPPTVGRYELLEPLGRGGMAEVYRARMQGVHGVEKQVALKRILPHALVDPKFVSLFVKEARISTLLMHPNLIQVFEFGQEDGELFLAMELVEGCDLRHVLQAQTQLGRCLSPEMTVFIAHGMLQGLEHAHRLTDERGQALNVVHRDLSPANLLLSYAGAVKVADFGVAHMDGPDRTDANLLKGKLPYMAPERLSAQGGIDARVDVFAAACVVYEMLVGERVYPGDVTPQLVRKVSLGEVPELRRVLPGLDPRLAEVVQRALHPDRDRRTPTAECFDSELMEWLHTSGHRPLRESDLGLYLQILVPRTPSSLPAEPRSKTPATHRPPPLPRVLPSTQESTLDLGSVVLLGQELRIPAPPVEMPPVRVPLAPVAIELPVSLSSLDVDALASPRRWPRFLLGAAAVLLALLLSPALERSHFPEVVGRRSPPVVASAEARTPFVSSPPPTLHLDSTAFQLDAPRMVLAPSPPRSTSRRRRNP